MSTKEYPLNHIQALHLLTGEVPKELETSFLQRVNRDGDYLVCNENRWHFYDFIIGFRNHRFRIYEPPAPEKLEPVELCQELLDASYSACYRIYGLVIAQAVRDAVKIAREEREAEKKK